MEENKKEEVVNKENTDSNNNLREGKKYVLLIVVVVLLVLVLIFGLYYLKESIEKDNNSAKKENDGTTTTDVEQSTSSYEIENGDTITSNVETKKSPYRLNSNNFEEFDIAFLKLGDKEENVIYSPLSIKYVLSMLNEGTSGKSNEEIKALIGDYTGKKYTNSSNMSIANALFVRDTFKNKINMDYIERINNKYGAEVIYDTFENADNLNKWISDKSFGLINKAKDKIDNSTLFFLVNSLAIDMDWDVTFEGKSDDDRVYAPYAEYTNTNYGWYISPLPVSASFNESDEKIATMEIKASLSNYDVVKAHGGEENFKNELTNYFEQCYKDIEWNISKEDVQEEVDVVYKNLSSVYGRVDKSTEYQFYTDDDVKVFAKDLKSYGGVTLQYVAFMPTSVDLESFIKNVNSSKLSEYINNLKTLERKNFKDGVITEIEGSIPKFKYEYKLDLIDDLKLLGVNDVFDINKADLSKITSEKAFISEILHDVNIDFNQYGIKAAATTMGGGAGNANGPCVYTEQNLPVEKINITFDKPYLYIVRDKNTGEVWFTGKVYNPLDYKIEYENAQKYLYN